MNDKISVFKTFSDSIEANLIKGLLESQGIPGFLENENIVTINPLYSNAVGGIRLMIFEKDFEIAEKILESENLSIHDPETDSEVECINCGSKNVVYNVPTYKRFGFFSALLSLLLMVYPMSFKKTYHCFDCGKEFKKSKR